MHGKVAAVIIAGTTSLLAAQPQSASDLGPAPLSSSQWGPSTGRTSAIACSATDAEKYYVAGPGSGVWRRDPPPAGALPSNYVWTPLTDDMPTLAIGALAIDPNDEDIVDAGTGDAEYEMR